MIDEYRNIYVADYTDHSVRKITPEGQVGYLEFPAGTKVRVTSPFGIALNASAFYVSCFDHTIIKVPRNCRWTKLTHKYFPISTQKAIKAVVMLSKRPFCHLNNVPKDLLFVMFSFFTSL